MLQPLWLADLPAERAGGQGERAGPGAEGRPGLPVLLGRPRRRAGARPRPGRAPHRAGPRVSRARPGRRGRRRAAATWCRPGGRCRCPTTARWPGCPSASSRRPGCAAGCARAASTCCTSTSRPSPSLSMLACWAASGPIVATFHTAMARSRVMAAAYDRAAARAGEDQRPDRGVSEEARRTLVEHLGGDAVVHPQRASTSTAFAAAQPRPDWPGAGPARWASSAASTSPARACAVLLEAFAAAAASAPGCPAARRRPWRRRGGQRAGPRRGARPR